MVLNPKALALQVEKQKADEKKRQDEIRQEKIRQRKIYDAEDKAFFKLISSPAIEAAMDREFELILIDSYLDSYTKECIFSGGFRIRALGKFSADDIKSEYEYIYKKLFISPTENLNVETINHLIDTIHDLIIETEENEQFLEYEEGELFIEISPGASTHSSFETTDDKVTYLSDILQIINSNRKIKFSSAGLPLSRLIKKENAIKLAIQSISNKHDTYELTAITWEDADTHLFTPPKYHRYEFFTAKVLNWISQNGYLVISEIENQIKDQMYRNQNKLEIKLQEFSQAFDSQSKTEGIYFYDQEINISIEQLTQLIDSFGYKVKQSYKKISSDNNHTGDYTLNISWSLK